MNSHIDLPGQSGALYRYRLAENADPRTPIGGNYVYVREVKGKPEVLLAGETNNLSHGAKERWGEAEAKGATHLFVRFNVAGSARAHELKDLLEALHPAMNVEA